MSDNPLPLLQLLAQRVVIFDGAVGTNLQERNLSLDDFWGQGGCQPLVQLTPIA